MIENSSRRLKLWKNAKASNLEREHGLLLKNLDLKFTVEHVVNLFDQSLILPYAKIYVPPTCSDNSNRIIKFLTNFMQGSSCPNSHV